MKKILVCILFILGLLSVESKAQKVAVKSNLLYDATTTMNLGLEVALARKWTLDIPVNYNPWKFDDARLKHWGIQRSFDTGSAKALTVRSSGCMRTMPTSM